MEFRIMLDGKVIDVLLDVWLDLVGDIAKQDPIEKNSSIINVHRRRFSLPFDRDCPEF